MPIFLLSFLLSSRIRSYNQCFPHLPPPFPPTELLDSLFTLFFEFKRILKRKCMLSSVLCEVGQKEFMFRVCFTAGFVPLRTKICQESSIIFITICLSGMLNCFQKPHRPSSAAGFYSLKYKEQRWNFYRTIDSYEHNVVHRYNSF